MIDTSFVQLVHWVISHGYFLFFVAAFFEGPMVTAAAGVASALGYYSIITIILLSILADLTADVAYYAIGYWGRNTLIARYGYLIGLTNDRIDLMQKLLYRHIKKAMIFIKLSPVIPVPGLIVIGFTRVPLRQFIEASLLITLPKSLLFSFIGFFAGKTYERFSAQILSSQYLLFGIPFIVLAAYFAYRKITSYILKNIK